MSIQPTLILDLDGTLADTIHDLVPSLNRTTATQNLQPVTIEQVGHVSGMGIKAMLELAYTHNNQPLEKDLLEELFVTFLEDYSRNISVDTVIYPGAVSALQKLSSNGWLLGICTNKSADLAEKLLREMGVHHLFSSVTGGDSFDFRKPDPRHLVNTVEMAGGFTSKAVMVGDTQNDILTARNADIPVIAVDFGYSEKPVTNFNPDFVISEFAELFDTATRIFDKTILNDDLPSHWNSNFP